MSGKPPAMRRLLQAYLIILAAGVPFIRPSLPGNTSVLDFLNLVFFVPFTLYLLFRGQFRTRLLPATLVLLFGSLVASINSQVVNKNLMTIAQEGYLYFLFLILLNVLEEEQEMMFLFRCWFLAACFIGALALMEVVADPSARARSTFENPNMAASYLGTSVFLLLVPGVLPWRLLTITAWLLIMGGMLATKSLSALVAVGAAGAILFVVAWGRATGRQKFRMAVAGGLVLLVAAVALPELLAVKNYAGRMDDSAEGRELIWKHGLETFLANPLGIGIGPAGFSSHMVITGGPFKGTARKELHSDYLSFLVERGVIGFAGLLLFLGGVVLMVWRCLERSREPGQYLIALCLGGMLLFHLVDSLSHEMLHYRHVWIVLGLIAARHRLMESPRPARSGARGAVRPAGTRATAFPGAPPALRS